MRKQKMARVYNTQLDEVSWHEYLENGNESTSSPKLTLSNTIHYLISTRHLISGASIPQLQGDVVCKSCDATISSGSTCLRLAMDTGDGGCKQVHICKRCSE